MDDSEVVLQGIAGLIDTEKVTKQLEQAFKDVSTVNTLILNYLLIISLKSGNFGKCIQRASF